MSEHLPGLVAPRNKEEFDELQAYVNEVSNELYTKLMIISVQTNHRLRTPKSNSKWAQKLAWARVDLRAYARSVTKPMASSAAAAVALGRAFRLSHTNFHNIQATAKTKGTSSGFDFS